MGKIQIVFVAVCLLTGLSRTNPHSRTLADAEGLRLVQTARLQVGVREATGHNDGKMIETYLLYTGLPKGNPWCAAFLSWVFGANGYRLPRTAWSPDLFPGKRLTKEVKPGNIYGLYSNIKRRIVHCGIMDKADGDWIVGIEGNTNNAGSVEGDGVYIKRRHKRTVHLIASWIERANKAERSRHEP